ncbi:MAG: hypothetical protein SOS98_05145 [Varibaculum sp.]|nr:hypothetical protein [Varibaculum sp.]
MTQTITGVSQTIASSAPDAGLYGPRGWTRNIGIRQLLAEGADPPRDINLDEDDYWPFSKMTHQQAKQLLERLPERALRDTQNNGPELGSLLRAALTGPIELSGYVIGPQRWDERLTVEAFTYWGRPNYHIVDPHCGQRHADDCQCRQLFRDIAAELSLSGYESDPDEILPVSDPRDPQRKGWWLWWD